jgi:hypothetical protein
MKEIQMFQPSSSQHSGALHYLLRFQSLFNPGRALAFPCDAKGRVDLDALSESAKTNYLFARAVVGREFAAPAVMPAT